jgi:hypothetical protein
MGTCLSRTEDDDGASPSPLEEKIISRLSSNNSTQSLSSNGTLEQRKQQLEQKRKALALVRKQRTDELQAKFEAGLFDEVTLKQLKSIERHRKLMLNIHSGSASKQPTTTTLLDAAASGLSPAVQGHDLILPHIVTDLSIVASFEASVLKHGESSVMLGHPPDDTADMSATYNESFQAMAKTSSHELMEPPPILIEGHVDDPNAVPDSLSSSDSDSIAPTLPSESVEQRALQFHRTPVLAARSSSRKLPKSESNPFTDDGDGKVGRRVRFCMPECDASGVPPDLNLPDLNLPSPATSEENGTHIISVPLSKLNRHRSSSGTVLVRESRRKSLEDLLIADRVES